MKRSCLNCIALVNNSCEFGYQTETIKKTISGFDILECRPLEECPKPLTVKHYLEYVEILRDGE